MRLGNNIAAAGAAAVAYGHRDDGLINVQRLEMCTQNPGLICMAHLKIPSESQQQRRSLSGWMRLPGICLEPEEARALGLLALGRQLRASDTPVPRSDSAVIARPNASLCQPHATIR